MSKRTVKSSKAIREAWNKEQELVQKGLGTRDWTLEQQEDILEKGKAYDDKGLAFEGQHMKSAEKFPEYQGDCGNIQFLTREEHLEAHDGNWRNFTNWYFDPKTKTKTDFVDGPFIPCEIIELNSSILKIETNESSTKRPENLSESDIHQDNKDVFNQKAASNPVKNQTNSKSGFGFESKIKKVFMNAGRKIVEFPSKHPIATKVIEVVGFIGATALADSVTKNKSSSANNSSNSETIKDMLRKDTNQNIAKGMSDIINRSSPDEHTVRSHGQHYHTRDGLIWREKNSYSRGGLKDE